MKLSTSSEGANSTPITDPPYSPDDTVIYLGQRRKEELDPIDIPVPDKEIIDPEKIEPTADYGSTEKPENVEGTNNHEDTDDVEAGGDHGTVAH